VRLRTCASSVVESGQGRARRGPKAAKRIAQREVNANFMRSLIERRSNDQRLSLLTRRSHASRQSLQSLDAPVFCKRLLANGAALQKTTRRPFTLLLISLFSLVLLSLFSASSFAQVPSGSEADDAQLKQSGTAQLGESRQGAQNASKQSTGATIVPATESKSDSTLEPALDPDPDGSLEPVSELASEPTPRALADLIFVDEPVTLVSPSPFFHQIPAGILPTLQRASRPNPKAVLRPREVRGEPFAVLQGKSPLIRGGQKYTRLSSPSQPSQRAEESSEQTMPEDSVQDALARQRSIDAYTAAIAELEVGGGAYNAALAEELNALGLLLQQQEEHDEAVRLFDRSVHISRINSGLHSVGQVQAIENKLASLLAAQRWAEADATFDYLFYVQKRAYGDNDPRLLPTLDSIAQWNLRAFSMGHGEPLALRLSNAMQYYSAAARVLQINFGTKDERLVSYMRGIANSSYLMARNPDLQAALNDPQTRNTQTLLRDRLAQPRAIGIQGFTSGAQALIQILQHEIERRDDALAIAEAFANLADWYLLFGRGDEAEEQYMNAWRLLANQDNGDALLEAAFGRIVRMPTFATDAQIDAQWLDSGDEAPAQTLRFDYADVMFDVSSGGSVRNVRMITQETEENEIQLRKLRRMVRDSTFRPIIKGGVPQRSEDNVLRYRYWY